MYRDEEPVYKKKRSHAAHDIYGVLYKPKYKKQSLYLGLILYFQGIGAEYDNKGLSKMTKDELVCVYEQQGIPTRVVDDAVRHFICQ